MLTVTVKFYGVIRDVTSATTVQVGLDDGATVMDLLDHLHEKYGREFYNRVLDESTGIRHYVKLFLNNQEVDGKALTTTRLAADGSSAEAMLYVMPAGSGGQAQD